MSSFFSIMSFQAKRNETMNELLDKLKNMKNATQSQYAEAIEKFAHEEVLKSLKEAGIQRDELSDEDFEELLQEQVGKTKMFAKGAMVASGVFLFLELLG